LNTPAGKIKTPNLAIVATAGKIKLLNKTDHLRANPELLIANAFHLFVNNKVYVLGPCPLACAGFGEEKFSTFENPVQISEKGVIFDFNEKKFELTPEKSIKIQKDLTDAKLQIYTNLQLN
jgi:queuine/archaeosine tRNA-ribosyltransferase